MFLTLFFNVLMSKVKQKTKNSAITTCPLVAKLIEAGHVYIIRYPYSPIEPAIKALKFLNSFGTVELTLPL